MSKQPSKKEGESKKSVEEPGTSVNSQTVPNRIVILAERNIPFEEERPPNFSPHFSIKVHQVQKRSIKEEPKK